MRAAFFELRLCSECDRQRLNAHDVHHPGEIVGEDVERHFGSDLRQTLHQEVRRAHPHLQRTKGMLGCLATLIACGFLSRRFCTASNMCSCSQRVIRRSLPVVQRFLIAQL